jgi:hypothetical protein
MKRATPSSIPSPPFMTDPDPEPDDENRTLVNIVLAVAFIVLVGGGIWLVDAMLDARRADECISSGRRNCIPLDVPPRRSE